MPTRHIDTETALFNAGLDVQNGWLQNDCQLWAALLKAPVGKTKLMMEGSQSPSI